MALITVCIPAYESHDFISSTLKSVSKQTFSSYQVLVAIERGKNWTLTQKICEEFSPLMPIEILVNEGIKGWAKNINDLVHQVDSPYYMILPHDDLLHPSYLSVLYDGIKSNSKLGVCYADMEFFGQHSGSKYRDYEGRRSFDRLHAFYKGGAEAVPWRGVTATALIGEGLSFNNNDWDSIWVECEYAQSLLSLTRVLRIPQGLYFKRIHDEDHTSVSRAWYNHPEPEFIDAFKHHRQAMLEGLQKANLGRSKYEKVKTLYHAAMLRRITHAFPPDTLVNFYEETVDSIKRLNTSNRDIAMSIVQVVRSQMNLRQQDLAGAENSARKSIELNPANEEAHLQMAKVLLAMHEPFIAWVHLQRANDLSINHPLYLQLSAEFQHQINQQFGKADS